MNIKEMLKNTLILFVITVAAGFLLGGVNELTKDTIALREQEATTQAYKNVFADAEAFEEISYAEDVQKRTEFDDAGFSAESINAVCVAKSADGSTLGYVVTVTSSEGYGGDIVFTVGIRNDGTVNGISLLTINETAGLGMNAEKVLVPQFANKQVDFFEYTKTGAVANNEIDAISGATITTRAITNGVNLGMYYFHNYLEGGAN